jgi:UDP-2,3-diacylglucosamine pyrophosphatase LpxH
MLRSHAGERRLVFISDLHLATDDGKRDFFAQDELADLIDELIDSPDPTDLVIAGDFFDLLQLTDETPGDDRVAAFQSVFESPEYTAMLDRLRAFTALPQHRTIYLVGNHDSESGWNDPLRAYLLETGLVSEIALSYRHTYDDGAGNGCLVYCEHGNDYDGVNTIGDYRNPAITPLGSHIVTDLVNYLEPLGRHASVDAPTSIADIDNIHPLGLIPWWFISNYFYQQVRRVLKYIVAPLGAIYLVFHLLPLYLLYEQVSGTVIERGLPGLGLVVLGLFIMFDSSILVIALIALLIRFDFGRTRRRYGLQDPDDIFRRGARHYRRTCEALVRGDMRPFHWPADEPWDGADLFVYGHTHSQELSAIDVGGMRRAFANTGTWTRKVIRIPTNLKLPPVFVPTYELTYVTVDRVADGIIARLWERPKALEYRLPWTERLATLGRAPPPPPPPPAPAPPRHLPPHRARTRYPLPRRRRRVAASRADPRPPPRRAAPRLAPDLPRRTSTRLHSNPALPVAPFAGAARDALPVHGVGTRRTLGGRHSSVGSISSPYWGATASSFSIAAATGPVGSARDGAGSPAAAQKRSKPAGVVTISRRAGPSPVAPQACGTPRGRKTVPPAPARNGRPPHCPAISPSRTNRISSSTWWTWGGRPPSAGTRCSVTASALPVNSPGTLIVTSVPTSQWASPSPGARGWDRSIAGNIAVTPSCRRPPRFGPIPCP